jgi:hypothetical protein
VGAKIEVEEIEMLKAEFSDEAATECWLAAQRILQRFGVANQNGETRYTQGDLAFAHTNGDEIEIRFQNHPVLLVRPEGFPRRVPTWNPGDWVHQVDQIDRWITGSSAP